MNEEQKQVLVIAAVTTGLMLVYPPFEFVTSGGFKMNHGFSFIFDPPKLGSSVNISPSSLSGWQCG